MGAGKRREQTLNPMPKDGSRLHSHWRHPCRPLVLPKHRPISRIEERLMAGRASTNSDFLKGRI